MFQIWGRLARSFLLHNKEENDNHEEYQKGIQAK